MDIAEFQDSFFEEAGELLDDLEAQLLKLDPDDPDAEQLNAIFRDAHSLKGGAGTFGFTALQHTTHLLENLLDAARRGEMTLRRDLVDTFLETKDMLSEQLDAYRNGTEPDPEALERVCAVLQKIAAEELPSADQPAAAPKASKKQPAVPAKAKTKAKPVKVVKAVPASNHYCVALLDVSTADRELLLGELGQLGQVDGHGGSDERYEVQLTSTESADDIAAVMCFIVEPAQLEITLDAGTSAAADEEHPVASADAPAPAPPAAASAAPATPAAAPKSAVHKPAPSHTESSSLRVPANKLDLIINLVGELVITQSMLNQVAGNLKDDAHRDLVAGIDQLERNARDLQEAVMSIRMVQMDHVFSRFPRLVRDLADKLGKSVELVTTGNSTELDKSLTERIIDPLTHLVRNSLDHGIEHPADREAAGKPPTGVLTLSAEHRGGNIVIEVSDDGTGLDRAKLLAKARERGMDVADSVTDDEVWQLIFAPGFSTAAQVSDVSGRGVGMDVVKRNIEGMGGHVEIQSRLGHGTTTRVVLPLTLAILDGMLVRVGRETFILPVSAVLESLQPCAVDLHGMAGGDRLLKVRDDYLPIVAVHAAMQVPNACTDALRAIAVVVQSRGHRYALLVDQLVGQQQVVVKNLETNYRKVPGVSAATILGDGSVALILDVNDLCHCGTGSKETAAPADGTYLPAANTSTPHHESSRLN